LALAAAVFVTLGVFALLLLALVTRAGAFALLVAVFLTVRLITVPLAARAGFFF
jgi:hypothetical protein